MMFLPEDKWSPRFDKQFYTIRMNKYVSLKGPPTPTSDDTNSKIHQFGKDDNNDCCSILPICNNTKQTYPATYYEIEVLRGNQVHKCLRRYSQFEYLCKKMMLDFIKKSPIAMNREIEEMTLEIKKTFPPKTIALIQNNKLTDDKFLNERREALYNWLRGLLIRQECVNNEVIKQFLELNDPDED